MLEHLVDLIIYLIFFALAATSFLIFSKIKRNKTIQKINRDVERSKIELEFYSITKEYYKRKEKSRFEGLEAIDAYFQDLVKIYNNTSGILNLKTVVVCDTPLDDDSFNDFLKQLKKCPSDIKKLVERKNVFACNIVLNTHVPLSLYKTLKKRERTRKTSYFFLKVIIALIVFRDKLWRKKSNQRIQKVELRNSIRVLEQEMSVSKALSSPSPA